LVAALLAVLLAVWALTAVWELAAERDRLWTQVQALQSSRPMATTSEQLVQTPGPLQNGVRPPAILPIAIPVPAVAPDVTMIAPETNLTAPVTNTVTSLRPSRQSPSRIAAAPLRARRDAGRAGGAGRCRSALLPEPQQSAPADAPPRGD
jgi:hypothetical protein